MPIIVLVRDKSALLQTRAKKCPMPPIFSVPRLFKSDLQKFAKYQGENWLAFLADY